MAGDLAFAAILELGRLLRTRRVSATELAELFLERLERFGPRYNCLVTVTPERALAAAARADRELAAGKIRGPLHGIPYGVKDLVAVRGYPTTWGAEPYRSQTFDQDATVVTRLDAAGAVWGSSPWWSSRAGWGTARPMRRSPGPGRRPGTSTTGAAGRPRVPARPWPPDSCPSPSGRGRRGRPSRPGPTAGAPAFARRSVSRAGHA